MQISFWRYGGGKPQAVQRRARLVRNLRFLLLTVPFALAGCGPRLPSLPGGTSAEYHLGPGDELRIITFGEQQLTGQFRVGDSGNVALPLIGTIPASGLTPKQLEQEIADDLVKGNFLREPSVSVEVITYRPVFVLGEVTKPGQYPYQPGMTVVTSVAVAGGYTTRADKSYASIIRTVAGKATEYKAGRNSYVQPGDVINIFEKPF
jgi:protein involved in polysaccharide export with SLBB domain